MSFSGGQKAKMAMCCLEFKKLAYLVETEDGNLVELSSQIVKRTSVSNLQTLEMIDCCRLGSTPPVSENNIWHRALAVMDGCGIYIVQEYLPCINNLLMSRPSSLDLRIPTRCQSCDAMKNIDVSGW